MKSPNKSFLVSLALGMFMVLSGILTIVMTPAVIAQSQTQIDLDSLVPIEFDGWKVDASGSGSIVNPEAKEGLDKIYSQTLTRTYVSKQGDYIMLSIAYGGAQKTDMHAHRPEICYAAGGFDVGKMTKTYVETPVGRIPVMRLIATQGIRVEPITYWIRVGDSLTRGWLEQKLTAIGYGLTGKVPDGLLVRVSSISRDEPGSFRIQQAFVAAMLQAIRSEDRFWLIGRMGS
ncbi:MAG: EpsI family protein [Nitrosomonadales bacterium]|nr:EpsI family protein [Nitrosomonadales bacterium]